MGFPSAPIPVRQFPKLDRRVAPVIVLGFIGIHGLVVAGFWVAYQMGAKP